MANFNRFTIFFLFQDFLAKFSVNWLLKIPLLLSYVATLPCEINNVTKQAIDDKLQGRIATYLRCGEIVNNEIEKGLLLKSVSENFFYSR